MVIKETTKEYGWSAEEAIQHLNHIGFNLDEIVGNDKFTKSHVMLSLDFAFNASL
ncbi:hypothetical protein [Paenibacillus polymyxa]|uniref:hypothetical protein n=1 Tax=Paenibacillus polymyxa TaxID=1406 RepID=UPI0025B67703|nr:hypothetical protein [Paenibacillus polymyxa]MDN4086025.1 hypothetical protein [Paenibacillus polymyxa]MDN4108346.1 hypothetical protein [Paenibacillus polymyxa]